MASKRDNFTQKTTNDLCKEVAGVCSNPDCKIQTLGPNNSKDSPANLGVAAHITAAAKNGPRYDENLTTEQRRSIDNAIWLCQNCAKLIDSDETRFPVTRLHYWKSQALTTARAKQGKPNNHHKSDTAQKLLILPEQPNKLIGRHDILTTLQKAITQPQSSSHLLVNGMGGVGKTAICKTLAHNIATQVNALVWLDTQIGLEAALQSQLALKIGENLQNPNWLEAMIEKLNQIPSPAVLFVDNLDNSDNLDNTTNTKTLNKLKHLNWHIVATSRITLSNFASKHPIDVLPQDQCIALFKHHYELDILATEQHSLNRLITLAGRHTLTIELLAKIANNDMLELPKLLQQVEKSGFDLSALTDTTADATHSGTEQHHNREHQLHQHLGKLFQLSALTEQQQDILRTIATLPYQEYNAKQELMTWLNIDKPKVLVELAKKGWLQQNQQHFALHPVLAFIAKQQIAIKEKPFSEFAMRFDDAIQPSETGHWIYQIGFIQHLEALLCEFKILNKANNINAYSPPNSHNESSAYSKSNAQSKLKPQHQSLLAAQAYLLTSLASMFDAKGQFNQALTHHQQALNISLLAWEKSSSQVATIHNNLGLAYRALGQYTRAIDYYQLALASDINNFGENHPKVAIRRNNLAGAYYALGQYPQAIEYFELALASDINNFGETPPQVAIVRNNLGLAYYALGQYDQAIDYYQLALTSDISNFGENHPNVAIDRNNLGLAYDALGQYDQAINYYQLALDCLQQVFPLEHPNIKTVQNNLNFALAKKEGK